MGEKHFYFTSCFHRVSPHISHTLSLVINTAFTLSLHWLLSCFYQTCFGQCPTNLIIFGTVICSYQNDPTEQAKDSCFKYLLSLLPHHLQFFRCFPAWYDRLLLLSPKALCLTENTLILPLLSPFIILCLYAYFSWIVMWLNTSLWQDPCIQNTKSLETNLLLRLKWITKHFF